MILKKIRRFIYFWRRLFLKSREYKFEKNHSRIISYKIRFLIKKDKCQSVTSIFKYAKDARWRDLNRLVVYSCRGLLRVVDGTKGAKGMEITMRRAWRYLRAANWFQAVRSRPFGTREYRFVQGDTFPEMQSRRRTCDLGNRSATSLSLSLYLSVFARIRDRPPPPRVNVLITWKNSPMRLRNLIFLLLSLDLEQLQSSIIFSEYCTYSECTLHV